MALMVFDGFMIAGYAQYLVSHFIFVYSRGMAVVFRSLSRDEKNNGFIAKYRYFLNINRSIQVLSISNFLFPRFEMNMCLYEKKAGCPGPSTEIISDNGFCNRDLGN